jgi:hypothetical protein
MYSITNLDHAILHGLSICRSTAFRPLPAGGILELCLDMR